MSSLCPPFLSPSICWPACPCVMPAVVAAALTMAVRHNGDDGSGGGDNFDVGIRQQCGDDDSNSNSGGGSSDGPKVTGTDSNQIAEMMAATEQ